MSAPTIPPVRPRRRWPRVVLYSLASFLVVFAIQFFIRLWIANRNLDAMIAETDAKDPDWQFDDIMAKRKAIPPEKNSARIILEAGKAMKKESLKDADLIRHLVKKPIQHQLNEPQKTALERFIADNKAALPIARRLQGFPTGRFDFEYTDDYLRTRVGELQELREVASLLDYDVLWCLEQKNGAQAARSCLATFHSGNSVGDEPLIIAQLVRVAAHLISLEGMERCLAQGDVPDDLLQAWQNAIAEELRFDISAVTYRGERAGNFKLMDNMRKGKVGLDDIADLKHRELKGWGLNEWTIFLLRPNFFADEQIDMLERMNDIVAAARLPLAEQAEAIDAMTKRRTSGEIARRLVPVIAKLADAYARHHTTLLCANTAIAAERYRLAHKSWPPSLQALVDAKLLPEIPLDPYDGQPLRLRRTDNGLVIYSVYKNKIDDAGASIHAEGDAMLDLGIQLWDPPARRAPPLPAPKDDDN
ncbi:MAG: hypothetical protein U0793_30885 [Gemmataceae bacterium]